MTATIRPTIGPTGWSLLVQAFDAAGLPTPITGFAGLDESHNVTVSGAPASPAVTLDFGGGRVTGPIPFGRKPAGGTSFAYHPTVQPGVAYLIEACAPIPRTPTAINTYQVYDGVLPLGSPVALDLLAPIPAQPAPTAASLAATVVPADTPAWRPLGTFTFASAQATVEITAAIGNGLYASALRLTPAGGSPIVIPMSDPTNTSYGPDRAYSLAGNATYTDLPGSYGAGYFGFVANSAYPVAQPACWYLDPAAIQAAVDAVLGANSCSASSAWSVAGPSSGVSTPLAPQVIGVAYSGPMAGLAVGAPSASDPAVVVAITHPGNQPISLAVNGATPVPILPEHCTIVFGAPDGGPQAFFATPLSAEIKATDVVTLDAPAGAILTAAGPSQSMVGLVLGRYEIPTGPVPTMAVGWNGHRDSPFAPVPLYSNFAHRFEPNDPAPSRPITIAIGDPAGVLPMGLPGAPNDPAGVWTFTWTGSETPSVTVYDAPTPAFTVVAPGVGTAVGLCNPKLASPSIYINCPAGTTLTGAYPPGLYGGPLLHPDAARHLAMGPVRTVDWTGAASSNIAEYSDFAQPGTVPLYGNPLVSVPLASLAPDASGICDPIPGPAILATTTSPHGMPDLAVCFLTPPPSGWPAYQWLRDGLAWTDPYGLNLTFPVLAHVTSPTSFIFQLGSNPGYLASNAPVVLGADIATPGAMVNWYKTPAIPWQDTVTFLCEIQAINPESIPHLDEPGIASDDCSRAMATEALRLAGKVRVGISNEPWNDDQTEWGRFRARTLAGKLGSSADFIPGYMIYADHKLSIWEEVFAAAGRAGDIVRCFNAPAFDSSVTAAYATYAVENKIAVHEIEIAPYTRIEVPSAPNGSAIPPALDALLATMTPDHTMDLAIVALETGPIAGCFAAARSTIDSAGLKRPDGSPVGLTAYEGGLDGVVPGIPVGQTGTGDQTTFWARHYGTLRHWLMHAYSYRAMGIAQESGCETWHEYDLADIPGAYCWSKVSSYGEPDGTGSPSDPVLCSQVAGGYAAYMAAQAAPAPPVVTPPATTPPTAPAIPVGIPANGTMTITVAGQTYTLTFAGTATAQATPTPTAPASTK